MICVSRQFLIILQLTFCMLWGLYVFVLSQKYFKNPSYWEIACLLFKVQEWTFFRLRISYGFLLYSKNFRKHLIWEYFVFSHNFSVIWGLISSYFDLVPCLHARVELCFIKNSNNNNNKKPANCNNNKNNNNDRISV